MKWLVGRPDFGLDVILGNLRRIVYESGLFLDLEISVPEYTLPPDPLRPPPRSVSSSGSGCPDPARPKAAFSNDTNSTTDNKTKTNTNNNTKTNNVNKTTATSTNSHNNHHTNNNNNNDNNNDNNKHSNNNDNNNDTNNDDNDNRLPARRPTGQPAS